MPSFFYTLFFSVLIVSRATIPHKGRVRIDSSILYYGLRCIISIHDVLVCIQMRRDVDMQASCSEKSSSSDGAHQPT